MKRITEQLDTLIFEVRAANLNNEEIKWKVKYFLSERELNFLPKKVICLLESTEWEAYVNTPDHYPHAVISSPIHYPKQHKNYLTYVFKTMAAVKEESDLKFEEL